VFKRVDGGGGATGTSVGHIPDRATDLVTLPVYSYSTVVGCVSTGVGWVFCSVL
jgi:hypothetical protein